MGFGSYYDWQGHPIDHAQWAVLFRDERCLAYDHIGDIRVSTVWLGLDHRGGLGDGPPLIFETMVFGDCDEQLRRYSTEAEARQGHEVVVAWVRHQCERSH